jgi:hypothetical protein
MFRPAMFTTTAALALGALSAAPAEAAMRLPLAFGTTLAAAEWNATGTRSGMAVVLVGRHIANQDECAQVVPVAPRHWRNQDECTAGADPVVRVGVRHPNQDECAGGSVLPVGVRVP